VELRSQSLLQLCKEWRFNKQFVHREVFTLKYQTFNFCIIPSRSKKTLDTKLESRDSSVGIATDYGLEGRSSIPDRDKTFVSIPQHPYWPWIPPSLLSSGQQEAFSPGSKQPGHGADNSPASSA
jgi:hypothetical protein